MNKTKIFFAFLAMVLLPILTFASPKNVPLADYKKGLELYEQGRYEQALQRFQLAIDDNWEFWQSYQMVGYCYFELRDKESALKAFEESLKINPDNPKLVKIYNDLKAGSLDIPVRPVEAEAMPVGTPVYIQTYYSYNK